MVNSWDLIRVFLALHRFGSFDAAARSLQIDQTTARRKLQQLEEQIGATLFARENGRMMILPEFEPLVRAALEMEVSFNSLVQQAHTSQHTGVIRLTTLDIFAAFLAPQIAAYRQQNPDVTIEITTEPHFVDLERDRVDIAVRLARPLTGGSGLKRLGGLAFGLYASKSYLAERRGTDAPHRLLSLYAHMGLLQHDFSLADEQWHERDDLKGHVVARADSYPALLRLCEEGMGLAMLPCLMAKDSAKLVSIDAHEARTEIDIWAVIRRDTGAYPKVRSLLALLTQTFAQSRSWLAGEGGVDVSACWQTDPQPSHKRRTH